MFTKLVYNTKKKQKTNLAPLCEGVIFLRQIKANLWLIHPDFHM